MWRSYVNLPSARQRWWGLFGISVLIHWVDTATTLSFYPLANDPFQNPATQIAWTKPPKGWSSPTVHFCGYRGGLSASALDTYNASGLGDVVWPQWPVLISKTLADDLQGVASRGLWLVDISNYVPGDPQCDSFPQGTSVCEYHLRRQISDLLETTLGEKFTGMDNGEQDGRYTTYAPLQYRGRGGGHSSRPSELRKAFIHFYQFFDRMADDLGNKMMALDSLWSPHYFAKTGYYTALGAETAQGLPNAQLFYAWLRGAAKQFGKWIWGNVSVYNRFGFKTCTNQITHASAKSNGSTTCVCSASGTSLSLMRRLMYQQLLYGVKIFGFETLGGCGDPSPTSPISPIAKIQVAGKAFADKNELGVHITQVAVMADFMSGFAPPRHLYAGTTAYRVWGNLPFSEGDFWMSAVFDLMYPGYTASSFFHNESGFMTATPFSDTADVLLSDCALDIMSRYPVMVVVTPIVSSQAETIAKFESYVESGGLLIVTAEVLRSLSIFGVSVNKQSECVAIPAGNVINFTASSGVLSNITETFPVLTCPVSLSIANTAVPPTMQVLASTLLHGAASAVPLAYSITPPKHQGKMVVLTSSGMASVPQVPPLSPSVVTDAAPLPNPFPMSDHVRALLGSVLVSQSLFSVGDDLSLVVNRVSDTEYIVAIANPTLSELALKLNANPMLGTVSSIEEILLDDAALATSNLPGYLPEGSEKADVGKSTNVSIAGVDQRIFKVTISQPTATLLPTRPPRPRPNKVALPITESNHIQESVLLRPTLTQHVDAIVVDWTYLETRSQMDLAATAGWMIKQNITVLVDFTSGLNLYPDLHLCNNSVQYAQSITRMKAVLTKMMIPSNASTNDTSSFAKDVIVAAHREPENCEGFYHVNTTEPCAQCYNDTVAAYVVLTNEFADINFHMQVGERPAGPTDLVSAALFLKHVGNPTNLWLAVHTAVLMEQDVPAIALDIARIGLMFVAAPSYDAWNACPMSPTCPNGTQVLAHHSSLKTLSPTQRAATTAYIQLSRTLATVPWLVVDASLPTMSDGINMAEDAEYQEFAQLEQLL
eukprot:m.270164 g.270164  ORF g.270164 m.270164 type:complete len:1053 (-) comp88335_c0_seq1:367-3525(-)